MNIFYFYFSGQRRITLTEFVNSDKDVTFNSPHEKVNVVLCGKVKRAE